MMGDKAGVVVSDSGSRQENRGRFVIFYLFRLFGTFVYKIEYRNSQFCKI